MTESQKRGRGRPRTIDRKVVVQTALRSWWSEGITSVSINEISRRTGLSKSSLYREFGGEDGLMTAALAAYAVQSVDPLLALFAQDLPAAQTLALAAGALTTDRGTPPGCFFTNLRLDAARLSPQTRGAMQGLVARRREGFEAWAARGLAAGELQPHLDAASAARFVDAQLTLVLTRMSAGDPPDAVRADAELAWAAVLAC